MNEVLLRKASYPNNLLQQQSYIRTLEENLKEESSFRSLVKQHKTPFVPMQMFPYAKHITFPFEFQSQTVDKFYTRVWMRPFFSPTETTIFKSMTDVILLRSCSEILSEGIMRCSVLLPAALAVSGIQANVLFRLVLDFMELENTGRIRVCNFINCWGHDNVRLMKEASTNFRCLVAAHSPDKPISEWFVPFHLQFFLVDLACQNTRALLKEAEEMGLFNGNYVWLAVNSMMEDNRTQLAAQANLYFRHTAASLFDELYITVMSQMNIATEIAADEFEITGIYKRYATDEIIDEKLGYWTKDKGLVFNAVASPSIRRQNAQGREFNASMVITNDKSLKLLHHLCDMTTDTVSKVYFIFTELTIAAMNATVHYLVSRKWGERINGSYDGMIGQVQRGEAEMMVTPLVMTPERMELLSYIAYGVKIRTRFIFLSPQLSYNNNIYLLPFGVNVWYCTIILTFFFVVTLRLVGSFEADAAKVDFDGTLASPLSKSWSDIIMMNIRTICQQDIYVEPISISGRILILYMKISILFLIVSYSAAILVLLQTPDRSLRDLTALYKSSLKLGVHNTPYNKYYFTHPDTPARKLISTKVTKEEDYMIPEEGVRKIRLGFFAFYIDTTVGYIPVQQMLDESEKCRLQEVDEGMMPSNDPMIAVKKGLPYSELIAVINKKLLERGLIKREARRRTGRKPACFERPMTYISIGLVDCKAAFFLLIYGMILSIIIFLAEKFIGKREKLNHRAPPHHM